MKRSIVGGALTLTAILLMTVSADADPPVAGCVQVDLIDVAAACTLTGTETGSLFAGSGPTGDGHTYAVRPACDVDFSGQELCFQPQACLSDDGQPGILMNLFRDGAQYGTTCLSDTQAEGLGVITPAMVIREFRRIEWPESPLTIQPPGQKTAVNFTTYYSTDNTEPSTQTVQIIGQNVEIEATPTSYVYRFDSTEALETTSPGGPYPTGDVTHLYLYKGSASPSIDTVYSGRYRINGGAWTDIPETLTVAGTPVDIEIIEIRPTLVAPNNP